MRKIFKARAFKIVLGSCLQWYDFALYGFFSSTFAKIFFPSTDKHLALLASLGAFAVGFLARPLGALLFGRLGDIRGRTYILKITPLLITIPTILLAFIPGYEIIGFWAPLLLVLSRIIQGIFLGAEFGGNMVYLCESVPTRRFFLGSLGSCSGSIGILTASIVTNLVSHLPSNGMEIYGWRLAFFLTIIPGIYAWRLRQNIEETPPYAALVQSGGIIAKPFKDLPAQKLNFVIMLGILLFQATTFYYVFIFLPMYLMSNTGVSLSDSMLITSIVLMVRLMFTPIVGLLADKTSPIIIFHAVALAFVVSAYSLSTALCAGRDIFWPYFILSLMTAVSAGVVPGLTTQLYATRSRYTLFSFTFNLGFGVFGGCTPALGIFLSKFGYNVPFLIPVVAGIVGLIAIQFYTVCKEHAASYAQPSIPKLPV